MNTRRLFLFTALFSLSRTGSLYSRSKPNPQESRKRLGKARRHAARGEFEKMKRLAEEARELDPNNAESYAILGFYEFRARRLEFAAEFLRASIERDPNLALARTHLGNVLFEQGERERALDEWTVGARLDPTDPEALSSLAVGLLMIDRFPEAKRNYEKALLRDRRYYDEGFLTDRQKGAAWSEAKAAILRPLKETIRMPTYPY